MRKITRVASVSLLSALVLASGREKAVFPDNQDLYGLSVVAEPADIEYYRSYLPHPLQMPEIPLVNLYLWYVPLPPSTFMEFGILALCEWNGRPGWAEVAVFVRDPIVYIYGAASGSRKTVAEGLALRPEGEGWYGGVRRFGKDVFAVEFTPMDISEMGELGPYQQDGLAGKAFLPQITEPRYTVSKLRRKARVLDLGHIMPGDAQLQTGIARISMDPGFPWSNLISDGKESPGLFMRFKPHWQRGRIVVNYYRKP